MVSLPGLSRIPESENSESKQGRSSEGYAVLRQLDARRPAIGNAGQLFRNPMPMHSFIESASLQTLFALPWDRASSRQDAGMDIQGKDYFEISATIPLTQWSHPLARSEKPVSDHETQRTGS